MIYSHNDHYRWGWGDSWFNDPDVNKQYQVQVGSCAAGHGSFHDETIRATQALVKQFTKPTIVGLSGGFDSQVVCLALLEIGHKFNPIILRLRGTDGKIHNQYDIDGAVEFCKKYSLDPVYEDLPLLEFYKVRGRELAAEHALTTVETIVQLHVVEKFGNQYSFIMGGGDPNILKPHDWRQPGRDFLFVSLSPNPIQQHLIKYGYEACTKFFMYTPEMVAAYLDNHITNAFYAAQTSIYDTFTRHYQKSEWWKCFNYYVKPMLYLEQWPGLVQRKKFTGFEAVPEMAEIRQLIYDATKPFKIDQKLIHVKLPDFIKHLVDGAGQTKVWRSAPPK